MLIFSSIRQRTGYSASFPRQCDTEYNIANSMKGVRHMAKKLKGRRKTFNEIARDIDPGFLRYRARYMREQGAAFCSISKRLRIPVELIKKWTSFIEFSSPNKPAPYSSYFSNATDHRIPSWDQPANKPKGTWNYGTLLDPDFRWREQQWRRRQQWARDCVD